MDILDGFRPVGGLGHVILRLEKHPDCGFPSIDFPSQRQNQPTFDSGDAIVVDLYRSPNYRDFRDAIDEDFFAIAIVRVFAQFHDRHSLWATTGLFLGIQRHDCRRLRGPNDRQKVSCNRQFQLLHRLRPSHPSYPQAYSLCILTQHQWLKSLFLPKILSLSRHLGRLNVTCTQPYNYTSIPPIHSSLHSSQDGRRLRGRSRGLPRLVGQATGDLGLTQPDKGFGFRHMNLLCHRALARSERPLFVITRDDTGAFRENEKAFRRWFDA